MSLVIEQSVAFEAVAETGETGLTGTIAVRVDDGGTIIGPTTLNIAEDGTTGVYTWSAPAAPAATGQYKIIWSTDGTYNDETTLEEDLLVVAAGTSPLPPPLPPATAGGIQPGPCSAWATADEVAACCSASVGSDLSVFDDAIDQASQLLFALVGRQFNGTCQKTVRPCRQGCGCFAWASGDHWWDWLGPWDVGWVGSEWYAGPNWWWGDGQECGCGCLSKVKLSGYPVREITEVKLDGVVLAPSGYRLDQHRYLIRTDDDLWPACQDLSKADTETGTWSITYTYGSDPPMLGRAAATQLACEFYKACNGDDCSLPEGTTRLVRQGVTIEKLAFATFSIQQERGSKRPVWRTGLPLVDAFLTAYNPHGMTRQPVFWAPGLRHRYAPQVG